MRIRDLYFWVLNKQGDPLVGNTATGSVSTGSKDTLQDTAGNPAFIKKSPDGWGSVLMKYGRSSRYLGMFRDFTVSLRFVKDGALILRFLYWMFGVEAFGKLVIHKNDRSVWPEKQRTWYTGEIDFSKFKQDKYGTVTVNVMEGGLSKLLKANENVQYEIEIDTDPEHVNVLMDGLTLHQKANFLPVGPVSNLINTDTSTMPVIFGSQDGTSTGVELNSQSIENVSNTNTYSASSNNYFLRNLTGTTRDFKYEGRVRFRCTKNDINAAIRIFYKTQAGSEVILFDSAAALVVGQDYTFDISFTLSMAHDDRIFLFKRFYGLYSPGSVEVSIELQDDSEFSSEFTTRAPASSIKGLYLYRLFQRLVDKMTDGLYQAKSDFLLAKKDIVVTSGDALRGIITKYAPDGTVLSRGAVIKTSLSDFLQTCFARGWGFMGIENEKLISEPFPYFFKPEVVYHLGQVDDCEFITAEDLLFNTIKAGYDDKEYDNVNGKYEVNSGQQYTVPQTRVVRELDLVSKYRADPYGIEFTRINLEGKTTTDNAGDNDTFMLNVKDGQFSVQITASFVDDGNYMIIPLGVPVGAGDTIGIAASPLGNNGTGTVVSTATFLGIAQLVVISGIDFVDEANVPITLSFLASTNLKLNRPAFTSITGIPDPETIFNVLLSPKYGLIGNGSYIRGFLRGQDNGLIKFTKADKNAELETELSGLVVSEKGNLEVSQLAAPLIVNEYATFTTSVPIAVQEILKTNPYGTFTFDWKGVTWKAFLWDGGVKPAVNDKQQWKMIMSADNDFTKLINS